MKKIICLLLLSIAVLFSGCAITEKTTAEDTSKEAGVSTEAPKEGKMNGDFRYGKWGDSREKIIELEGEPDYEEDTGMMYNNVRLMRFNTSVVYLFGGNGLSSGVYTFTDKHTNNAEYINDYEEVKKALTEKYGTPASENEEWTGDLFKDDPGLAIASGYLKYEDIYYAEGTGIIHKMTGDNFEISHFITYLDPENPMESDKSGL